MSKKINPVSNSIDKTDQVPSIWASASAQAISEIPDGVRLYRLPQVLNIVPISRAKFLKMVSLGSAPPPIKIGRTSLFVASDIHKFVSALVEATRATKPFNIESLVAGIVHNPKK